MVTFWERAADSVYRFFYLYFDLFNFSYPHFGSEGGFLEHLFIQVESMV